MKWKDRSKEAMVKRQIIMNRRFDFGSKNSFKSETVDEFLKRGGVIKRLIAKNN